MGPVLFCASCAYSFIAAKGCRSESAKSNYIEWDLGSLHMWSFQCLLPMESECITILTQWCVTIYTEYCLLRKILGPEFLLEFHYEGIIYWNIGHWLNSVFKPPLFRLISHGLKPQLSNHMVGLSGIGQFPSWVIVLAQTI